MQLPAQDLPDLIRQLIATPGSAMRRQVLGEHAEWGPHQENTARLLEVQNYQLQLDWTRATTDPEDPQVRRELAEHRRHGVRPPARPIIPPAAERPPQLAEQRLQAYLDELTAHRQPTRVKEFVSTTEFDRALGLE